MLPCQACLGIDSIKEKMCIVIIAFVYLLDQQVGKVLNVPDVVCDSHDFSISVTVTGV